MLERQDVDQRRLKIARHETGHAVMALICRQPIQSLSLKEKDSPLGTDKYRGSMSLLPADPKIKFTGEKAIQKIMISLGGYASEILFYDGVANIGGDDLTIAARTAEDMLQVVEFRNWVAGLPVPEPSALDMIANPLARAYIHFKMGECIETLDKVKPAIHMIAEELYKKEELTGGEASNLFHFWNQEYMGSGQAMKT